jgi:hypothetical protein
VSARNKTEVPSVIQALGHDELTKTLVKLEENLANLRKAYIKIVSLTEFRRLIEATSIIREELSRRYLSGSKMPKKTKEPSLRVLPGGKEGSGCSTPSQKGRLRLVRGGR